MHLKTVLSALMALSGFAISNANAEGRIFPVVSGQACRFGAQIVRIEEVDIDLHKALNDLDMNGAGRSLYLIRLNGQVPSDKTPPGTPLLYSQNSSWTSDFNEISKDQPYATFSFGRFAPRAQLPLGPGLIGLKGVVSRSQDFDFTRDRSNLTTILSAESFSDELAKGTLQPMDTGGRLDWIGVTTQVTDNQVIPADTKYLRTTLGQDVRILKLTLDRLGNIETCREAILAQPALMGSIHR